MINRFGLIVLASLISITLSGCASILASMSEPGHIDEPQNTRTFGTYVEDQNIEVKIKANLYNADSRFQEANVAVFSYNRIALLVGQVPNQEMYDRATQIAEKVRLVRNVHNELTIGPPLPISKQLNDSWISTKIRANMITTQNFPASKVQVITESGTVFLMGLLSESEANWAVDIVSQIDGVKKIIKIIEFTQS